MDIITKGVLSLIQQEKKYSILAGGAVRDTIYKVEPKDYDIFVPVDGRKDIRTILKAVETEFQADKFKDKSEEYAQTTRTENFKHVYEFLLEGKTYDLIFVTEPDDDEFAEKVIGNFDYGINMLYHDGNYLSNGHDLFKEDYDNFHMTLHNLKSMSGLPKAIARYQTINMKLGGMFQFRSSCLSLKEEKRKEEDKFDFKRLRAQPNPLIAAIQAIQEAPQPIPFVANPQAGQLPEEFPGADDIFN